MQTIEVLRALSDAFANAAAQLDQTPDAGESPTPALEAVSSPPLPGTAAAVPLPGAVTPPLPGTAAADVPPLPGADTPPTVSYNDIATAFQELYQKAGPQVAQSCLLNQLRVNACRDIPEIARPQALQIIKQNMPAGA